MPAPVGAAVGALDVGEFVTTGIVGNCVSCEGLRVGLCEGAWVGRAVVGAGVGAPGVIVGCIVGI